MALTAEDVLARRTRSLFLNVDASIAIAKTVAEIMAEELGRDRVWIEKQVREFNETARNYRSARPGLDPVDENT